MTLTTISEFLDLSLITAEDLLKLLSSGDLNFEKSPSGELLIEISSISPELLAGKRGIGPGNSKDLTALETEQLAEDLSNLLGEMIDEAWTLAQKWLRRPLFD